MIKKRRSNFKTPGIWVILIFNSCLIPGMAPFAQENTELYEVLESAQEVLDSVIKEASNGEYQFPYELTTIDEFDRALLDFQNVLGGGDLETMANWFPSATELMRLVDVTPGLESYADWLRQRLDYAAVANQAVNTITLTEQPEKRLTQTKSPQKSIPNKPVAKQSQSELPRSMPAQTRSNQRAAFVRNTDTWVKKLADRPVVQTTEKLVPALKKIFSAQGVPEELVWIAEVESTFNPKARSPAGAVGLFQLMPATAKHLGLQVEPEDQRLDPSKNGQAAAKYLKDLHARFDDWPLAIAAYNGGEGRIAKLLKANDATNLEAISGQLPSQTQMYVPKVLATIRHREGFDPSSRW